MQSFFQSLEKPTLADPEKLALAYANHFWGKNGWEHRHTHQELQLPKKDPINNVSILAKDTSLSFLTKRVSLVSDTTILTHYKEKPHVFYEYIDTPPGSWGTGADRNDTTSFIRCPSLNELGEWLRKCKSLLLQGDVFYFPDIFVHRISQNSYDWEEFVDEKEESVGPLCDLIAENRKIIDLTSNEIPKSSLVQPIIRLDLPYIDNVDLETFSKITADERDAIQRFRDFLRIKFLDLKANEGSESYNANLAKIGIELRDAVRGLNSDFDTLKRKNAFQVTQAVVSATTATLVAINSVALGTLPQVLGTSGGIIGVAVALQQYVSERHKFEDAPLYYLWLFSKRMNK
jgi:hypothetical protein